MTQIQDPVTQIEDLAGALDLAMSRVADLDPTAATVVTQALEALNALHKTALTSVVRRLKDDPRGKELLFELVDEPEVRMVLSMHAIIRADPETVARQVLDGVRSSLQSHGGDVELDGIRGGVAYVRLQGACNGCSMAAVTMRDGVEKALVEGVAGVTAVEVLPNDPSPTLIPLSSIGIGAPADAITATDESALRDGGWSPALGVAEVPVGSVRSLMVDGTDVVLVNGAGQLAAYVNACAHQGLPLDDAEVELNPDGTATLTCPWHGFCYDAATGECTSMPGAQLQQLPLRIDGGRAWIRTVGA